VPRGNNWFDSLQAKAKQRMRYGLNMQVAFTWQKELTDAEGTAVNDVYNMPVNKIISGSSVPFATVASFTYTFPTLARMNNVVKSAVKDWTLGGSCATRAACRYNPLMPPTIWRRCTRARSAPT